MPPAIGLSHSPIAVRIVRCDETEREAGGRCFGNVRVNSVVDLVVVETTRRWLWPGSEKHPWESTGLRRRRYPMVVSPTHSSDPYRALSVQYAVPSDSCARDLSPTCLVLFVTGGKSVPCVLATWLLAGSIGQL